MTEPSQTGRVRGQYFLRSHSSIEGHSEADFTRRKGQESHPVQGGNKKVSANRPLDQGQMSLEVSPTIATSRRQETAILGATGPPVDPPNLSLVIASLLSNW